MGSSLGKFSYGDRLKQSQRILSGMLQRRQKVIPAAVLESTTSPAAGRVKSLSNLHLDSLGDDAFFGSPPYASSL